MSIDLRVSYIKTAQDYKQQAAELHHAIAIGSVPNSKENLAQLVLFYEMAFTYLLNAVVEGG